MTLIKEILIATVLILTACTDIEVPLKQVIPDRMLLQESCECRERLELLDKLHVR